jgi:uncharacterized protein YqjF (DUF2071 family)
MTMPFLTTSWLNLILATYRAPTSLLEKRLPPGLELDTRDGDAFVSVVGFEFFDTRVLGVPWPGHRHFAELNLRYYVRHGSERGVVFIREFVPRRAVSIVARLIYNEPYRTAPLRGETRNEAGRLTVSYILQYAGREHTFSATATKPPFCPAADSVEHFFKEHQWGFGISLGGRATRFLVEHPVWDVYPVDGYAVDLDWQAVYGSDWAFLQGAEPESVILAVGSKVKVYPKGKLDPMPRRPLAI